MVREIQGPNNQPPKPTGVGQGGVRAGYEGNKGGGGQSGKKAPEPEPEPPKEEAEEEGHLDADSFARKRYGSESKNFLADERMPWEVAAEERRKRLAEVQQKRAGGTGPLSQAKAAPKGLPQRHGLSAQPAAGAAKPPTRPLTPPPAARRPEAGWDADVAASSTLNAYQQLRDRQETRERDRQPAPDEPAAEERGGMLASGPSLNRDAISAARRAEEAAGAPEPAAAPAGPSWLVDPIAEVELPKAPPVARRAPAPEPEAPRPAQAAPRLRTGPLSAPADPAKPAAARAATPATPRREPLTRGPIVPQPEPAAVAETPAAPMITSAEAPEVELELEVEDAYEAPTAPEAGLLEELLAEEPMLQGLMAQVPVAKNNNRLVCHFQILDGATKKPLAGARLEFEPVQDDRLPVINGQADFDGWYKGEGIPPGHYQVTVRSPGYIPQMQTCYIKAGEVDESVFHLKKP